ncbi:MAG: methyltransferase domain-containing protein [Bacteroidales bacterium]|jgi:thiopurine S-methyltransferase|nr:class I SAM-dependent methyltransferase [Bacteroidales bacterium]MDD3700268.1 methyltransferase domain-containing protein [Bacteroidales bacterium]MDY0368498.1 methyltransferase domain-containing protein [Bacteroidales bacterium]
MSEDKLLNPVYWREQYLREKIRWDLGYISPPIQFYFDQFTHTEAQILVPGAGLGWEAAYLHYKGHTHVFALDFVEEMKLQFCVRHPSFPSERFLVEDFYQHQGSYDILVEHSFFSGMPLKNRADYVDKAASLLKPNGKLIGLLFNREFDFEGPPFGGNKKEYEELFSKKFWLNTFETAYNSSKPRAGKELFCIFQKK